MKKILMIGTGGTIASEMSPSGLTPELNTRQLLSFIPHIAKMCQVDCVQLFSLDSTNLQPGHWIRIARALRDHYDNYDGFVISHGTDTMAYTAAALSYLVQGSGKPIVLTGAQKPIWFDGTDSKRNLTDAFLYACRGCGGVQIVFNGKVILGTRARKTCSKSFQAFSSVNYPDLAVMQDEHLLQYIALDTASPGQERPVFYETLDPNVGLLKLIPGTRRELLSFMVEHYDGLVIESFGVGGLPEYEEFHEVLRAGVERGRIIVMTTQVPNEGSDLAVYHVGGHLKSSMRLLEAFDMTTEAAVAKLMWILGQTRDFDEASRLFYTPVARDILYSVEG
jgi:L-asparaginase